MYFTLLNIFMKKVVFQLRQRILKYKKKLIYWVLALFIGQICFFNLWWVWISNVVYADGDTPNQSSDFQKRATERFQSVQYFQKLIYLLIYPILILAGKLVDNSLVYWEVFYFDAVLWKLWNIMRNLANFWLWFIFIFKIFQYLIKWQKWTDIKKLLTSALIAWVWIQASRFIMAALIDVSTVLTYWVWWLPLSTLKNFEGEDEIKYNSYHVPSVIYVDAEKPENYHLYFSNLPLLGTWEKWNAKFISQCWTFTYKDWDTDGKIKGVEIIIAPQMVYYESDDWDWYTTESDVCHMWGDIYYFSKLYNNISWTQSSGTWRLIAQLDYDEKVWLAIEELQTEKTHGEIQSLINDWTLLLIWNAQEKIEAGGFTSKTEPSVPWWLDVGNEKTWTGWWLSRLNDIIDEGGYAWVFAGLYWSLLNAWTNLRFSSTTDNWIYVWLLNAILSFSHMLAIAIPLIAMMIVFLLRIGVLWMAIVLSPIIVLLKAFDFEKDVEKKIDLWKYITVENLIPIIFSPVVICFAISMSTVLVRIISAMNRTNVDTWKQDILWWIISLDIAWLWVDIWKLVCSVICIAITWFLVWAAVKSSKLWESGLITWIEKFTNTALWSVPIVPIPTKDWLTFVWKDAAFWWNGQHWIFSEISNGMQSEYSKKSSSVAEDLLHPEKALERQADAYKTELTSHAPTGDWTQMPVTISGTNGNKVEVKFANIYKSKKEEIIKAINDIDDDSLRDKFWNSAPEVVFEDKNWKDVTYKYVNVKIDGKETKRYKKQ